MEDVWKELSLASLDHHYSTSTRTPANAADRTPVSRLSLQELFSSSPLNPNQIIHPPPPPHSTVSTSNAISNPTRNSNPKTPNDNHCACSKRKPLPGADDHSGAGDRKKYRLMKNRESAARSRARKQAYTYELEAELEHLMEENSKLKKQQEQLCAAEDGDQKQKLQRTLTAPF